MMNCRTIYLILAFICGNSLLSAQEVEVSKTDFWTRADTLNHTRFNLALGLTSSIYVVSSYGLYQSWYKKNKLGKFHLFNDNLEWGGMDKYGHMYSAYTESILSYKVARWSGLNKNKSILVGVLTASIVQTTIEVMDGFSEKWGFSYGDMVMNGVGISVFALQERYWGEQRIQLKWSSLPRKYNSELFYSKDGLIQSSIQERTDNLFGSNPLERLLKDYNAQTYWASFNIASFLHKDSRFPRYINVALGYGAENLFGGFENKWNVDGHDFELSNNSYERYHQFYLGLDIDFSKIEFKNSFLKTLFSGLNIFKMPAPAIEFNTKGEVIFHLIKI